MRSIVKGTVELAGRLGRLRAPFALSRARIARAHLPLWRRRLHIAAAAAMLLGSSFLFFEFPHKAYRDLADGMAELSGRLGFEIRTVRISGNEEISDQTLIFALGARPGEPIFAFDIAEATERLKALQWVEKVSIQRLWPDTLHVVVDERDPFALWQNKGRIFVVDAEGNPLEELGSGEFADLPLVVGEGANTRAQAMIGLMRQHPALAARVKAYVRVADRRWNLRLHSGADVKLPEEGVAGTLAFLEALEAREGLFSRDLEMVDLRLEDRIVVRLSESAQERRDAILQEARRQAQARGGNT